MNTDVLDLEKKLKENSRKSTEELINIFCLKYKALLRITFWQLTF